MDVHSDDEVSLNFDWTTDDELEIQNYTIPFHQGNSAFEIGESSSSSSPRSQRIDQFIKMGFPRDKVEKALKDNGGDDEAILEDLLSCNTIENLPAEAELIHDNPHGSSYSDNFLNVSLDEQNCHRQEIQDYDNMFFTLVDMGYQLEDVSMAIERCGLGTSIYDLAEFLCAAQIAKEDDLSLKDDEQREASSSHQRIQDNPFDVPEIENKIFTLVNMGYEAKDVSMAIQRCGKNTSILDLTEFLGAAQMAREFDLSLKDDNSIEATRCSLSHHRIRDRLSLENKKKRHRRTLDEEYYDDIKYHIPNPMIGFGVPGETARFASRTIPREAKGPPYFYYENVALTPRGTWKTISRFLYDIVPEFVDSKYFCAAARKRGYIHNLPIENRFSFRTLPRTILEALSIPTKWWPSWDERTQLNCILTCIGSAKLTDRIRDALKGCEPSVDKKKYVMAQCRKWNMVWVGKNTVAPLSPDEIEGLMGFDKYHTRGSSNTDRYTALGNSFQVDTVAYHLSVLKKLYPCGINVLSLFSGIGGAEVALHKLGIHMKNVVSVEKSDMCRRVLQKWWEQTEQTGNLIHINNVIEVSSHTLDKLMHRLGGFDLVIGGSPCNNLAGGNRVSRDGLEGEHSSLFFHYFRILDYVMTRQRR